MLTFEKVFSVFESFLAENGIYEVVSTSHEHTILEWDSRAQEWIGVKLCATPEDMALVSAQRQEYVAKLR